MMEDELHTQVHQMAIHPKAKFEVNGNYDHNICLEDLKINSEPESKVTNRGFGCQEVTKMAEITTQPLGSGCLIGSRSGSVEESVTGVINGSDSTGEGKDNLVQQTSVDESTEVQTENGTASSVKDSSDDTVVPPGGLEIPKAQDSSHSTDCDSEQISENDSSVNNQDKTGSKEGKEKHGIERSVSFVDVYDDSNIDNVCDISEESSDRIEGEITFVDEKDMEVSGKSRLSNISRMITVCRTGRASKNMKEKPPIMPGTKRKPQTTQSWLLRLFESKMFDMSIAISYLFNSKEPGVQTYLGKCL